MYVRLTHEKQPTDPGPGEHLWIATLAHKLPDEAVSRMVAGQDPGDVLLDQESLICPPGVGCYKCELPLSKYVYHRKCTGSMDPQ
jgi:hypothetical protein